MFMIKPIPFLFDFENRFTRTSNPRLNQPDAGRGFDVVDRVLAGIAVVEAHASVSYRSDMQVVKD
jgi:hypothetical protein